MPLLYVVLLKVHHSPSNSIRSDSTPVEECQRFIIRIEYYIMSVDVNPKLFQDKSNYKLMVHFLFIFQHNGMRKFELITEYYR